MTVKVTRKYVGVLKDQFGEILATAEIKDDGIDCLGGSLDPDAEEPYVHSHKHTYRMSTGIFAKEGQLTEVGFNGDGGTNITRFKFKEPLHVTKEEALELEFTLPANQVQIWELDTQGHPITQLYRKIKPIFLSKIEKTPTVLEFYRWLKEIMRADEANGRK